MSKAKQAKKVLDALDLSLAARMKRAEEMGFDTSKKWFHGTQGNFEAFDPKTQGKNWGTKGGFFFSNDPGVADIFHGVSNPIPKPGSFAEKADAIEQQIRKSGVDPEEALFTSMDGKYLPATGHKDNALVREWAELKNKSNSLEPIDEYLPASDVPYNAQTYPTHLKMQNPKTVDWSGLSDDGSHRDIIEKAKQEGFDSVILKNANDNPQGLRGDTAVVFDPSQIRSVNAKFDPKKKKSGNILDSIAPIAVAGAGGYAALSGEDAEAAPGDKLKTIAKTLKNGITKIELKDGAKTVGKLSMPPNLTEEQRAFFKNLPKTKSDDYRMISWADINPEYRGYGYYPEMLAKAVEEAKAGGSKGIYTIADGGQSPDSKRVWDKFKNKIDEPPDPNSGSAQGKRYLESAPVKAGAIGAAALGASESWADALEHPIQHGVGDTVSNVLDTVDKYTANPMRAAAKGLIERKNPFQEALDSVLQNRVVSGNDVARAYLEKTPGMGIPMPNGQVEYPAEDVMGLAADLALDPTNFVPIEAAKNAPKLLKTVSKLIP